MKRKVICYLLGMIYMFSACINGVKKELDAIEGYIDLCPSRVLITLDSIQNEMHLSSNDFNRLNLLIIIAKSKLGESIVEDSLIFDITNYYKQEDDLLRSSLASFYSGRVYQERRNNEKAMEYYIDAEEYAKELIEQEKLKGLIYSSIGDMLFEEFYIENAINRYLDGLKYFEDISDYRNVTAVCNSLGMCYTFLENKKDSASYYFDKGFNIANSNNDKELMMACKENAGLILLQKEYIGQSIQYFSEALSYASMQKDSVQLYFNIGRAYAIVNNIDSSLFFVNKLYEYDYTVIPPT